MYTLSKAQATKLLEQGYPVMSETGVCYILTNKTLFANGKAVTALENCLYRQRKQ